MWFCLYVVFCCFWTSPSLFLYSIIACPIAQKKASFFFLFLPVCLPIYVFHPQTFFLNLLYVLVPVGFGACAFWSVFLLKLSEEPTVPLFQPSARRCLRKVGKKGSLVVSGCRKSATVTSCSNWEQEGVEQPNQMIMMEVTTTIIIVINAQGNNSHGRCGFYRGSVAHSGAIYSQP